jgi:hypothetical protein
VTEPAAAFAEAWPAYDRERLAEAVAALAHRVEEKDVRVQLHALSAVIRNLDRQEGSAAERARCAQELDGALAAGNEEAVTAALRRLTAVNREAVRPVDWSAASGG